MSVVTYKTPAFLIIFFMLIVFNLNAQDCIEYPDIEGAFCENCVPPGWVMEVPSPGIVDPDGNWGVGCILDVDGESPGGGNMALMGGITAFFESISTTVSGLDPSLTYNFGFWWHYSLSCESLFTFGPTELLLTIDGTDYTFSGSEEWELIDLCIDPSSTSIEIIITGSPTTSMGGVILVDTAICEDLTPCCPLIVEILDEEIDLCADEPYVIPASFDNEEGSVDIEWTCDPPDGLDFLSETYIIDPTFLFPFSENHPGGTYEFTVTVEDDECIKIKEIIINVIPNEVPEFDIIICELAFGDVFPLTSLNGYTGSWTGDFDFEDLVGTVQEYTFIIDPDQDNCLEEYTYEIPILAALELDFDYNNLYCAIDDNDYALPDESIENIEGEWSENDFNPSDLGVGVFTYVFQPNEEYCAFPFEAEIEIYEESILSFEIPDTFCISSENYELPTSSLEGIVGTWEYSEIDLSTPDSDEEISFTPEDINDCYQVYEHTYSVLESLTATFSIPDTICRMGGAIVFDSLSNEGVLGIWSPLTINPDTIIGNNFNIQWTALSGATTCGGSTNLTITVEDELSLLFDIPPSVCRNDAEVVFPTQDISGSVTGEWNLTSVDPIGVMSSSVDLTFTPTNSECTLPINLVLEIIDLIDPEFDFNTEFCSSDENLVLPTVSDNNISGTWSIPEVQPNMINGQVVSEFTPDDVDACINPISVTFTINNIITPIFDLPEVFCFDNNIFTFPTTSLNNVEGNWSISEFDISTFSESEFVNEFIPLDVDCNEVIGVVIPIINFDDVELINADASSCSANDGEINIVAIASHEYSIDNGLNWQTLSLFSNLGPGNYTVLVRDLIHTICSQEFETTITAPSAPVILMIETSPISDCGESNGMAVCTAEGDNLEYSIDGGATWQIDSTFKDLDFGNYNLLVRANGDTNCSTEQAFEIENIEDVVILEVIVTDISNCGEIDGTLEILPLGPEYEYSIEGSNEWQTSNLFNSLGEGDYLVLIRITNSPNCTDTQLVNISSPIAPQLLNLEVTQPSDCGIENGQIIVTATGNNLEFSIDTGITWTDNNIFSNLNSGLFTIQVREKDAINCNDEESVNLETPNTPELISFDITGVSDCITNDGAIDIVTSTSDVEFSIDNGSTWQGNGIFSGLLPQNYVVIIRNITSTECQTTLPFEIENIDCPCNDLDLEIVITDANCFNSMSGEIEVVSINGFFTTEDFKILWSTGSESLLLENLTTGWYSYQIEYDRNCTQVDSVFIGSYDPIDFSLLAFDANCKEGGSIEVSNIVGGSGQFQFSLDGINFQDENVFFNLTADEYQVIIEDNYGCVASKDITVSENYNLQLDLPQIEPINQGDLVTLNPLINESTIDSFEWSPMQEILDPNQLIAQVSPNQTTEYTLTIYSGDCVESRTITVYVIEKNDFYLGNIFSLNEGNNNVFYIQSSADSALNIQEFSIFDRWGNLVFVQTNPTVNDPTSGWDGRFNNEFAVQGVYTYMIKYSENGQIKVSVGSVTLLR